MSQIRVTVREAWEETDPNVGQVMKSALLTTLQIEDAGSVDANRAAARAAVNIAAGGRPATISMTTQQTISATVRRAPVVAAPAPPAGKSAGAKL